MKVGKRWSLDALSITKELDLLARNRKEALDFQDNLGLLVSSILEPGQDLTPGHIWTVNSAFRGKTLNARIGGSPTSQHCLGLAADVKVEGYEDEPGQIAIMMLVLDSGIPFGQMLLENGCTHFGVGQRRQVARWERGIGKTPIPQFAAFFEGIHV